MQYRAIYLAAGLLSIGSICQAIAQSEADIPEPALLNPEVMPPMIEDAAMPQEQSTLPSESEAEEAPDPTAEMELVTRGIYQCLDQGKVVFVDEESRNKYSKCSQIRAPHYQRIDERFTEPQRASCSGAITYQGNTYIFNDQEPCPIPEAIFKARKPIEANPEYYTQPSS